MLIPLHRPLGLPHSLRALHSRNYRLFFGGQGISLIGTWITRVATSWLVYRLTGSALLLGVVGFAGQIPSFVLTPISGVLVDRWSRHRILLITQVLSLLQSAALAVLTLSGIITVGQLIALSVVQGVINAFDTPARQAFVIEMVGRAADVPNAIALNSSMVNLARLIGPTIGGLLIATVGEGWCFALDSASYLAVIASLVAMRLPPAVHERTGARVLEDLASGVRYAAGFRPIRSALLLLALVSFMGIPYTTLMPVVATRVLGGGADTLGFLLAASGVGALGGAVYLATRSSVVGLGRTMVVATAVFGGGLVLFSLSRSLVLSLVILPVVGAGFMVEMASTNTVLQTIVEPRMRGRVMAFYTMAFLGMAPFGSLLGGVLAARIGAPGTIAAGAIACLLGAVWFSRELPALREVVWPIYERMGLVPAASEGADARDGEGARNARTATPPAGADARAGEGGFSRAHGARECGPHAPSAIDDPKVVPPR